MLTAREIYFHKFVLEKVFLRGLYGPSWPRETKLTVSRGPVIKCLLFLFLVSVEKTYISRVLAFIGQAFIGMCFGILYLFSSELYPTSIRYRKHRNFSTFRT